MATYMDDTCENTQSCLSHSYMQTTGVYVRLCIIPVSQLDIFIVCAFPSKTKKLFSLSLIQLLYQIQKYFDVSNLVLFCVPKLKKKKKANNQSKSLIQTGIFITMKKKQIIQKNIFFKSLLKKMQEQWNHYNNTEIINEIIKNEILSN